jgi:hypothetical protein
VISHWDEAETERAELGHLAATWTDLSDVTGAPRREPTDVIYYARRNAMYFRGAGITCFRPRASVSSRRDRPL